MSYLRPQGVVLRSPVPCCTRWALRASSGGAPEASRGCSRGARGPLGSLRGRPGPPPTATFWGAEATSETLWEDAWKIDVFSAVLASMFSRFLVYLFGGVSSMDGSSVGRRFWHRFRSKIVPESMKMTSEEPGDSGGRLGSVSGASWERLGSSRTALGTAGWQKVKPPRVQSRLVTRYGRGGSCWI